jgi:uncharacterized protein (UPF0305 family)
MDIREIRRYNLGVLRHQVGSLKELAALADTDPNYLSQLASGTWKSAMGHAMARRLEKACKKPVGWMDQEHTQEELDEDLSDISEMAKDMSPDQRRTLRMFMRSLITSNSKPPAEHREAV